MNKELIFKLPNPTNLSISVDNHLIGFLCGEPFKIPLPKGYWLLHSWSYGTVKLINLEN